MRSSYRMLSPPSTQPRHNQQRVIQYQRPLLYPKQEDAFFCPERYSFVEASTKSGKTHACIVWIVELAVLQGFPGWNGWWVAPTGAQAKIAMRRIKNSLDRSFYRSSDSDGWIEFPNGARLWFKTGDKPDNLYGEDVYAAVFDEASRGRYDSWLALRSTLTATGGPIRLIANVKGKSNWFYLMCRAVERNSRPGSRFTRISCWDAVDAGLLARSEIEDAKSILTPKDFLELYEAKAQDDEDAFLPSQYIEAAIERGRANSVQPYGALVIGGDPSQGKGDPAAFCFRRGPVVEEMQEHKGMDEFGFVAHTLRLIEVRKPKCVFIDATGFGSLIVKLLHEKGTSIAQIVKGFHMAERSLYPDEYENIKAQCYGEGRKWLISTNDPPSIVDDDGFAIELGCQRTAPNSSGRLQIESKDDLKKRGYDSSNKADAWSLTFAEPIPFYTSSKINYPEGRKKRNLT